MPLELATTISQLDESWPLGTDLVLQGDDHLRLIKAVLKTQFPGENDEGFDIPILATETEINHLQGLTGNVQDQIDAITSDDSLSAPSGTVMVFYQVAPPVGWTQVLNHNDSMLRVVNTAGGGFGGTSSPISASFSHVHTTAPHILTVSEIPSHDHEQNGQNVKGAEGGDNGNNYTFGTTALGGSSMPGTVKPSGYVTIARGGGQAHSHGNTGTGNLTFTPRYLNTILAAKD